MTFNMDLQSRIKQLAESFYDEVIGLRRHLHQNPELSFEEAETSIYIQEQLQKAGIPFKSGYVKTGIVGSIKGKNASRRVVALRADMDALPIIEQNNISFKSENAGKMHACGHDLHMASLLGAARILNALKDNFEGTVLLIFQPGEEKLPGGANLMLKEGALRDIVPDLIIGQHGLPGLEAGKVGYKTGIYMASSDEIYISVKGKGGHAAMPHQLIDPVLIAAHIIVSLQQIVSRNADPAVPSVLSFGKIEALGATNVIPAEVKIEGTFRTMNEAWRKVAHEKITAMAKSTAESMGGACEVNILYGYPVLINHEHITRKAVNYSKQLLGNENVVDLDLRMTSEDFAYFSQHYPAVFYRFGTTDPAGNYNSPLHSSTYMADERALLTAMSNLAWLAVSFLKED
jgi:amidohydrolase